MEDEMSFQSGLKSGHNGNLIGSAPLNVTGAS
jgi:hypothetical protein